MARHSDPAVFNVCISVNQCLETEVVVKVEVCGPEIRDVFLEKMAATFRPLAVERKAAAWDWMFNRQTADDMTAPSFVLAAMQDERLVGGIIVSNTVFQFRGKQHITHCGYGTNIDPKIRGLGINLVKAVFSLPHLAIGTPNSDRLVRVNQRYGAVSKPRRVMFKILRGGRALARRKRWAAPFAGANDMLWRTWLRGASLIGPRLGRNESITRATEFGDDYARFWEQARQHHNFIQVRDVPYMTWRYLNMPLQSYEIYFLRDRGEVKGYVVIGTSIDPERMTGQITDILTVNDDVRSLALLLAAASERLMQLGAEIAAFGFADHAALQMAGRKAGFIHSKLTRPALVYHSDPVVLAQLKEDVSTLYLTRGDQDEDY